MRAQYVQIRSAVALIPIALLLSACAPDPAAPANDDAPSISAAKASPTSDMSVTGATPDSATQDTTLDVIINGSGFVSGTAANWSLAGVQDPAQVRTNSTRYVNSRQLVANITISSSAAVAKWDIVVTAAGKKGGIGTEAFAVKAHGQPRIETKANLVWEDSVNVAAPGQPAVWQKALLTGDYRNLYGSPISNGTSGEYQHAFCGSFAYMQVPPNGSYPEAALNFDTDFAYAPATMDGPCGGERYYQVFFSGRSNPSTHVTPQHFALQLGTLAVGQSLFEEVHFGVQLSNCAPLRYDDAYPPSNNARVTRLTDTLTTEGPRRRWRVESQGSHRAMCTVNTNKGVKTIASYYLPFAYTITEIMAPFPSYP
jgi:hypothetical protein